MGRYDEIPHVSNPKKKHKRALDESRVLRNAEHRG